MRKTLPSLRRDVFAVLHGQQDARAVVEAVAVFFGEVVNALARGDFALAEESLANRLAEFRRAGLCRLQRHRDHALEHLEGVVGMSSDPAAGVGAILWLIRA